jgi:hypothetical protein
VLCCVLKPRTALSEKQNTSAKNGSESHLAGIRAKRKSRQPCNDCDIALASATSFSLATASRAVADNQISHRCCADDRASCPNLTGPSGRISRQYPAAPFSANAGMTISVRRVDQGQRNNFISLRLIMARSIPRKRRTTVAPFKSPQFTWARLQHRHKIFKNIHYPLIC